MSNNQLDSFQFILIRCDVFIKAASVLNIQMQVELEVIGVAYCIPETARDGEAVVIFTVMLSRPCSWAANGCEHLFTILTC